MANPIGKSAGKNYLQVPSFDKVENNRDLFKRFPDAMPPASPYMPRTALKAEIRKEREDVDLVLTERINLQNEYLEHKGVPK